MPANLIDLANYKISTRERVIGSCLLMDTEIYHELKSAGWKPAHNQEVIRLWKYLNRCLGGEDLAFRAALAMTRTLGLAEICEFNSCYSWFSPEPEQLKGSLAVSRWAFREIRRLEHLIRLAGWFSNLIQAEEPYDPIEQ